MRFAETGKIIFSDNDYLKFLHALEEIYESKNPDASAEIYFLEKENITNVIVPKLVRDIAISSGVNVGSMITSILRGFELEYKHGHSKITKSLLNSIKNYQGISKEEKEKLLAFLICNLNIEENTNVW